MQITILAFGQITEIINVANLDKDYSDTDLLKKALLEQYPAIAVIPYTISVNQHMITKNTVLKNGDVVALLPPFSGG